MTQCRGSIHGADVPIDFADEQEPAAAQLKTTTGTARVPVAATS